MKYNILLRPRKTSDSMFSTPESGWTSHGNTEEPPLPYLNNNGPVAITTIRYIHEDTSEVYCGDVLGGNILIFGVALSK